MHLKAWANLKVAHKLGLAACAFAVPLAFLIWTLVGMQAETLAFTLPEVAGARYLAGLSAIQAEAGAAALSGAGATLVSADRLTALQAVEGKSLDCAQEVAAAAARLTAPGVGLDAGSVPGETLRLMAQGVMRDCQLACALHELQTSGLRWCTVLRGGEFAAFILQQST